MNNTIIRKITVDEVWQPLSSQKLIGSVELSCPPTNTGNVAFETDNQSGVGVDWVPGEYHTFKSIDLSQIRVRGTFGDVVTMIGGTW